MAPPKKRKPRTKVVTPQQRAASIRNLIKARIKAKLGRQRFKTITEEINANQRSRAKRVTTGKRVGRRRKAVR